MLKRKYAYITKALSLLIAGSCIICGQASKVNAQVINFKDKSFEEFILTDTKHSVNDYTEAEEKSYTAMKLDNNNVWSLEGIQNFSNLETINIKNSSISDISPLSNFKKLRYLNIDNSCITNISALKNLQSLTTLSLSNIDLENYSAIGTLENISVLYLINCNIKDLSMLRNLKHLQKIVLSNNYIDDISVISELPNLQYISLADNEINDITPLLNLKSHAGEKYTTLHRDQAMNPYSINLNENLIDTNKNSENEKVIKNLKENGFDVNLRSSKNDTHILKVNGSRYMPFAKTCAVNFSKDIYVEFNKDLSNMADNLLLKTYNGDTYQNVDFTIEGNILKVKLDSVFKDNKNIYLKMYDKTGKYLNDIDLLNDTELKGDMDGNGEITLSDLSEIAKSYNKNSKDAVSWDIRKDVNRDGIIDIYDLTKISSQMN